MAATRTLSMTFVKENGDAMSMTLQRVKENPTTANIKSFMDGLIANGTIFENQPAVIRSAKIITREETPIDLS